MDELSWQEKVLEQLEAQSRYLFSVQLHLAQILHAVSRSHTTENSSREVNSAVEELLSSYLWNWAETQPLHEAEKAAKEILQMVGITASTQASSQSDREEQPSGPAEHDLYCVRHWAIAYTSKDEQGKLQALEIHCGFHNVSWWLGVTPARDVATGPSTSQKPDKRQSAEKSEETVKSPWNWSER